MSSVKCIKLILMFKLIFWTFKLYAIFQNRNRVYPLTFRIKICDKVQHRPILLNVLLWQIKKIPELSTNEKTIWKQLKSKNISIKKSSRIIASPFYDHIPYSFYQSLHSHRYHLWRWKGSSTNWLSCFQLELKQLYVAALWFRNRGGNSSIPTSLTVERRGSVDCVLVKKNSQRREATTIVCCHRSSGPTYRQIIQIRVDGHSAVADIVFS